MKLLVLLALAACEADPVDTDPDTDTGTDTGEEPACDLSALAAGEVDVDPDADTRIHPSVAFDGQGLWIAWNRPDEGGLFDVWASRIGLDGAVLVPPLQVDAGAAGNHTYPRVAVAGDTVLVAWQTDDQVSADNLTLRWARLSVEGELLDASPRVLEPVVGGAPVTGNGWMPAVAPAAGGYALAGAFALPDAPGFQVVVQPLGADGGAGAAVVAAPDAGEGQVWPAVATSAAGTLLAFEGWPAEGANRVRGGLVGAELPVLSDPSLDASGPAVAWERAEGGSPYLAFAQADGADVDVVLLGGDLAAPLSATLGVAGRLDYQPALAAGERGGLAVWLRRVSGIDHELVARPFGLQGPSLALGPEEVLPTDADVAPYPLSVAHVCEDAFAVVSVEGDNPDFAVVLRFVRTSPPE